MSHPYAGDESGAPGLTKKPEIASYEFDSPYINAPVWPWSLAGWSIAFLWVLLFLRAWLYA